MMAPAVMAARRARVATAMESRRALARAFGCARVVYNDVVRAREEEPDGETDQAGHAATRATDERAGCGGRIRGRTFFRGLREDIRDKEQQGERG